MQKACFRKACRQEVCAERERNHQQSPVRRAFACVRVLHLCSWEVVGEGEEGGKGMAQSETLAVAPATTTTSNQQCAAWFEYHNREEHQ